MRIGSPPVTFVYHLGVHATDEDLLIRTLLLDRDFLVGHRILVPRPRHYRQPLAEVMSEYRGDPPPDAVQAELAQTILRDAEADRVILSDENFLCMPPGIFAHKWLYSRTSYRSGWSRNLFPDNPCEFHLAIRNPATFLQAMLSSGKVKDYATFLNGVDPREMRWSQMLEALRDHNPDCPITVWCHEDTPLIWPTILREIADVDHDTPMTGELALLESIMQPKGFERMKNYIASTPPQTEIHRRRLFEAFLDKFAKPDALELEIDLPGWTDSLLDQVTANYEDDIETINKMPGITLITT